MRRLVAHASFLALAICVLIPSTASAYSVRVHIYIANSVHDDLMRNLERTDRPLLRLMTPDGAAPAFVELGDRDSRAITRYVEYFRGGAIGPDNTVLTGMTDPSHAWMFSPFAQCSTLLEEAALGEGRQMESGVTEADLDLSERAYALGCFLHGITDNNAHHVVNYFTNQTFTLYPIDTAEDGELKFHLLNVVRHIVTETNFEAGLLEQDADLVGDERDRPGVTRQAATLDGADIETSPFRHRIPINLVRRVYFDPDNDTSTGLWESFGGQLADRKREALRAALGIAADADIPAAMVAADEPWETDRAVIGAYVEFLRNAGLAPADYLVLLPEILKDIGLLYRIVDQQGPNRHDSISSLRIISRRLLRNAFAPTDAEGNPDWDGLEPSRFQGVMDMKLAQIDMVMDRYLETVQNISNLNVIVGLQNSTREQRTEAFAPLSAAIDEITDINYEILFTSTTAEILGNIGVLRDALDDIFRLATEHVRTLVVAQARVYLDQLRAEFDALKAQAIERIDQRLRDAYADLQMRVAELREAATSEAERRALDALGLDLNDGRNAFDNFLGSVLYMNSYNSVAGVLTVPAVVDPGPFAGPYQGPVSFDASYQVEYNQLSVCRNLRDTFYPCGTSTGEMLQPDYRHCARVDAAVGVLDPPIECHGADETQFAEPDMATCARSSMDAHLDPMAAVYGSYTLSFPPRLEILGDEMPVCRLADLPIEYTTTDRPYDIGGMGGGSGSEDGGCAVAPGTRQRSALPVAVVLFAGLLFVRRRRG